MSPWEKYIKGLHDLGKSPIHIVTEAEEKVNEDDKGSTILKTDVLNAM